MTEAAHDLGARAESASGGFSATELDALRRAFAGSGYLVFRDVVPKEELSKLRAGISEAFEGAKRTGRLFSGGGSISGHLNCYPGKGSEFAYDALVRRGIIDVIRTIAPQSLGKLNVGCNFNLPHSVAQHYHADGWYTGSFMIANVAVVDTDLENGAIDLLPGTHQRFYKYWQFAIEQAHRGSTRIPMKQGDVLIRVSTLWHRGMPNHTSVARPMIAFTFGDPGSPRFEQPFDVAGGGITFHENWYRSNALGRLRERTFVAAPFTYSAYRFVTSLVGNKGYAA